MIYHHRQNCRLCGSEKLQNVIHLEPTPLADLYLDQQRKAQSCDCFPLDLYFCENCYHVQLLDVIDPGQLFEDYLYETKSSPGLVRHFKKYADDTIKKFGKDNLHRVMDIGSNDGTLLSFFKQQGLNVLGVDAAKQIAAKATEKGIETIPGFFDSRLSERILRDKGPMDIITANNVYAHADNLADITDGISNLLTPDGIFIFEVSNLYDLIKNKVFDFIYHEHLCYHSVLSLDLFFKRHGMVLFDVQRISTKGGSIRGYAKPASSSRPISPSVARFIKEELDLGLDQEKAYRDFESEINQIKAQVKKIIAQIKKEKKTVYVYGASATTTTLIYHFELMDDVAYIIDDNTDRQDLFSPGCHIPIVSSDQIYTEKPDYIFIAAWRFADMIIKKHDKFMEQGGQFIIPLPELKIV